MSQPEDRFCPAIHDLRCRPTEIRGWSAFADHDVITARALMHLISTPIGPEPTVTVEAFLTVNVDRAWYQLECVSEAAG
jgi:hypothetical protein